MAYLWCQVDLNNDPKSGHKLVVLLLFRLTFLLMTTTSQVVAEGHAHHTDGHQDRADGCQRVWVHVKDNQLDQEHHDDLQGPDGGGHFMAGKLGGEHQSDCMEAEWNWLNSLSEAIFQLSPDLQLLIKTIRRRV